jgi:hypothetical protein
MIIDTYLFTKERRKKSKIIKWIIEKANEVRRKYGIDDLDFVAGELGAEVVEKPLGIIIKEVYFKDESIIVVDSNFIFTKRGI